MTYGRAKERKFDLIGSILGGGVTKEHAGLCGGVYAEGRTVYACRDAGWSLSGLHSLICGLADADIPGPEIVTASCSHADEYAMEIPEGLSCMATQEELKEAAYRPWISTDTLWTLYHLGILEEMPDEWEMRRIGMVRMPCG